MDPSRQPIESDAAVSGQRSYPAMPHAEPTAGFDAPADVAPADVAPVAPPAAGSSEAAGEHGAPAESFPIHDDAKQASLDPADTLSPAVRRLVRQYDLDITGIHGTGPAGKIRVGDVIGMLGGRADVAGTRAGDALRPAATAGGADTGRDAHARAQDAREAGQRPGMPTTTVFDCDLSRVLSHRKRERRNDTEIALTSYFLVACADAVRAVPEIVARRHEGAPRLGVLVAAADGGTRRTLVVATAGPDDRLRMIDGQLRAAAEDHLGGSELLVHHYGPSGSLLATPTEIGTNHAASVGIGRVRREIVLKTVDGEEAPRVTARCHVTLTFRPEVVTLARANQFVAALVRVLEQWPAEPASA